MSTDGIELVQLDRDHPGFRDPAYRARRNAIARIAVEHRLGEPLPEVEYTPDEHAVWRTVWENLAPLHRRSACRSYVDALDRLALSRERVPQLREVSQSLERAAGFSLAPVAGLVTARVFLSHLATGVFLSTQYMRHPSAPLYTPEPDVIHELVGHAPTLIDPDFVRLSRLFGAATLASDASEPRVEEQIIRVYWYTLEFGVVEEDGLKAYGAGLLSSFGELGRFATHAELRPFDLDEMARTPFDPTDYQRVLFVAPGFRQMVDSLSAWLERLLAARPLR